MTARYRAILDEVLTIVIEAAIVGALWTLYEVLGDREAAPLGLAGLLVGLSVTYMRSFFSDRRSRSENKDQFDAELQRWKDHNSVP